MTADLVEDSFSTTPTRTLVAKLGTGVIATLQQATTKTGADMLGLKSFVDISR